MCIHMSNKCELCIELQKGSLDYFRHERSKNMIDFSRPEITDLKV